MAHLATKPNSTAFAGLVSVSIPESKSAALRLFYALLDARVNEYPMEPTDIARGYAETIFAIPAIPIFDADDHLIKGANFSLTSMCQMHRLVKTRSALRLQAGQIVVSGNKP